MSTITTRSGKGSPLTHDEVDSNFTNLNTDKYESGDSPSFVNITVTGTVDGRDIATDGTKLDGIEASATADQSAAEIKTAYESNADTNAFTDADHTKLDGIEASADVTDGTNVTAAGALMDSELTSEASVKALDQGVATTDSPSFAGLTTTADINFGDNDKAIFGAGNDLQIYHDGSNSYIDDSGAGDMLIRGSARILFRKAGTTENMIRAEADSYVKLYYDNAEKLATTATGVDVTGTVVSDGLTVDTDTLAVDSTNNRVGIGTTSPANKLEVSGAIVAQGAATAYTNTGLYLQNKGSSVFDVGAWRSGASTAELTFSTDSGSDASPVERMRIDSSGNVGIGTTNPARNLQISDSGTPTIRLQDTGGTNQYAELFVSGSSTILQARNDTADGNIIFRGLGGGSTTERMRIDGSGDVGIGTSSPASLLHLSSGSPRITLTDTGTGADHRINADSGAGNLAFDVDYNSDTASPSAVFNIKGSEKLRITSAGNVGIGTSSPAATVDVSGNARGAVVTDNDLSFDLSAGNNFSCTPTGGGTLTFTNHLSGQSGFVLLDNSGGHAIAAAGTTKINAADLTAISTAGVYTLSYFDNGTNAYVSVSRSFA